MFKNSYYLIFFQIVYVHIRNVEKEFHSYPLKLFCERTLMQSGVNLSKGVSDCWRKKFLMQGFFYLIIRCEMKAYQTNFCQT